MSGVDRGGGAGDQLRVCANVLRLCTYSDQEPHFFHSDSTLIDISTLRSLMNKITANKIPVRRSIMINSTC